MVFKQKQRLSEEQISIVIDENVTINGNLCLVEQSDSIVVFAHGSGSSRFSPRNRYVAQVLQESQISTLLIDLLTVEEGAIDVLTCEYRFDIPLLTRRVIDTTNWLCRNERTKDLCIGFFGASTGAAAVLKAAAEFGEKITAIVSRGGRCDLVGNALSMVKSATLLIVGGNDPIVIDINERAMEQLSSEKKLTIISGASHLFEEPGKLKETAKDASDWFVKHLIGTKMSYS